MKDAGTEKESHCTEIRTKLLLKRRRKRQKRPIGPRRRLPEAAQAPVRYAIQIMASSKSVSLRSSQFGPYRGKVKQYVAEGRFPL